MTIERLRALYALILARGRRSGSLARVSVEHIAALAAGRGSVMDRLRTLDVVMTHREHIVELDILRAAVGVHRTMRHRLVEALGGWPMAMAATVVLAVGMTALARTWSVHRDTMRGGTAPVVQLVKPTENVSTRTIEFSWKPVRNARDYEIEVLDADGLSTFVSTVQGTTVRLPASVRLIPGAEYRWWVVARRADGSRVGAVPRRLRVDEGTNGSGAQADKTVSPHPVRSLARSIVTGGSSTVSPTVAA